MKRTPPPFKSFTIAAIVAAVVAVVVVAVSLCSEMLLHPAAHFLSYFGQFIAAEILRYAEVEAFELAPYSAMGVPDWLSTTVLPDGGEKAGWMVITKGVFDLAAKEINPVRPINLNILNFRSSS